MNIYDIAIAPGAGRQIDVQADYIYFRTGSAGGGDTTIVFQPISGGEAVYLQPGQAYKMPAAMRGKVVSWIIRNLKGEGTINGVILMGEGEFQDNRVSGSVEVIDGGRNTTMAGRAFMLAGGVLGGANQCGAWGLWNPANSGKQLVISAYAASSAVAGAVSVRNTVVQLAQDNGARGAQKKIGGAAIPGVARYMQESMVNGVRRAGEEDYDYSFIQPNSTLLRTFKEPIIVMPGAGLHMLFQTTASILNGTFEWVEEPV